MYALQQVYLCARHLVETVQDEGDAEARTCMKAMALLGCSAWPPLLPRLG